MNRKTIICSSASFLLGGMLVATSMLTFAESTVTTPKGTFKCDNTCVVDEDGNVSDCCGGHVWKRQAPVAPKDP